LKLKKRKCICQDEKRKIVCETLQRKAQEKNSSLSLFRAKFSSHTRRKEDDDEKERIYQEIERECKGEK
jgi:hypothetical protein